ncbi:MAG: amino acid permease [Deltaproteobacteria bacterium]|nr:amino acid permease [Deltaproteobacteria bacterium]MCB9789137.1 amino acid permease [Deltaproteobacteria bacterium]
MPAPPRLARSLGLRDVYAISTGTMFSSGLFLLPGLAAAQTGATASLAYLAAALLVLPAMLAVAELSTAMPRAGGAYFFLDRGLGPLAGTVAGLGSFVALVLKSAFALIGFGAYLALLVDLPIKPLAVGLTLAFAAINLVGAQETARLQRWLVGLLVGVLGAFVSAGLFRLLALPSANLSLSQLGPLAPSGVEGFFATVALVVVSYAGLTTVASVAEEVRSPERNLPLGMALSLGTAAAIYTLGVLVIGVAVPHAELTGSLTPVADAATRVFGGSWGVVLVIGAAFAAFASTGNAGILSSSRYPMAMARDGLAPPALARVGRFGTPTRGILLTAATMLALILALDVAALAKLASAFQLILFALICVALIVMRESGIAWYRPTFRVPLYPWLPLGGVAISGLLVASMGMAVLLFTVFVLLLSAVCFAVWGRRNAQRSGAILHAFQRWGRGADAGLHHELRRILDEREREDPDGFAQLVGRAAVLTLPEAQSLTGALGAAAALADRRWALREPDLGDRLLLEARQGFMPIARGAAIPHLRLETLARPELVIVHLPRGVVVDVAEGDAAAEPSEPVYVLFFLLSPEGGHEAHLRLLARLAARIEDASADPARLAHADHDALRAHLLARPPAAAAERPDPRPPGPTAPDDQAASHAESA